MIQAAAGLYLPHHRTIDTDALTHALAACPRHIAEAGAGRGDALDGMVIPTIPRTGDRAVFSAD